MIDTSDIGAFLGLDIGKGEHHTTAVTPAEKKALDKQLPNSEPKLREVFGKLQAKHGTVLVVADQPTSIGALPLAVTRDMGYPSRLPARAHDAADRRSLSRRSQDRCPRRVRHRGRRVGTPEIVGRV